MKDMVLDTKEKRILKRQFWDLAYPSIIAFTLQGFYDIIDMMWVGKISKEAIAGVTLFSVIYALFGVLNEVAGASSVSMISQSYGRGTEERTQTISEQTISFKVVLAIITGTLIYLSLDPILNWFSSDPLVIQAAKDYGIIRTFALPIAFSSYSVNTIFRCTGDSKTPMKVMLIATAINMVLDPLLMFNRIPLGPYELKGFGLGVYGAGLATVISICISFGLGFFILVTGRRDVTISMRGLLRLDKEIDLQLLSIGLPAGGQLLIRQAFNTLLMGFITSYGTLAVTIFGLGTKLVQFSFSSMAGFAFAGSTMVGHALGREHVEEASYLAKVATTIIVSIIGTIAGLAMLFPRTFLGFFNTDPAVLNAGSPMLRWLAASMIIAAFGSGMRIVFSGSGFNRPVLISTIISRWIVQLPLMYVFVKILQVPLNTLWISFIIAELADLAVVVYYFRRGDWKLKRVG